MTANPTEQGLDRTLVRDYGLLFLAACLIRSSHLFVPNCIGTPQLDSDVSYRGEAFAELIGAYVNGAKIALLVWVKHWDFPEKAMEGLWNRLCQRLYEELEKRIPDLKWFNLEIHFLDSMEDLEKAAFLTQDFP